VVFLPFMTASALAPSYFRISDFEFRFSAFTPTPGGRGAKLDLTVTLADPAKRGGAFTGSQGLHLQTLNKIVAMSHPSSSARRATHRAFGWRSPANSAFRDCTCAPGSTWSAESPCAPCICNFSLSVFFLTAC